MKKLTPLMLSVASVASVAMIAPSIASADPAPKGPDFTGAPPARSIDPSLAASDGTKPIAPTDVIWFRKDSDVITPAALSQIQQTVRWLGAHKDHKLVLEGHTDKLGRPAFNADLATRRADSVRTQLMLRGVSSDRIVVETFGAVGATGKINELERAVVMATTTMPVRVIVDEALEKRHAIDVTWTDNGTLFTETMTGRQAAKTGRVGNL